MDAAGTRLPQGSARDYLRQFPESKGGTLFASAETSWRTLIQNDGWRQREMDGPPAVIRIVPPARPS
jgi:hypothetical protein